MKTLLTLLLTLTPYVYAQPVHIPDPNLDAAIRQALNLPADTPITETDMARLTRLYAEDKGIQDFERQIETD